MIPRNIYSFSLLGSSPRLQTSFNEKSEFSQPGREKIFLSESIVWFPMNISHCTKNQFRARVRVLRRKSRRKSPVFPANWRKLWESRFRTLQPKESARFAWMKNALKIQEETDDCDCEGEKEGGQVHSRNCAAVYGSRETPPKQTVCPAWRAG